MATRHAPKHISSCHSCRALRIGCDLRTKNHSGDPCSNCKRRGRDCTIERVKVVGRRGSSSTLTSEGNHNDDPVDNTEPENHVAYLASPAESSNSGSGQPGYETPPRRPDPPIVLAAEENCAREQLALTLHHILWDIFTGLFETQVGIWIGSECCPFKHTLTAPTTLISRLMINLDNSRRIEVINPQFIGAVGLTPILPFGSSNLVNQALLGAVHAYSARWLPVDEMESHSGRGQNTWTMKEGLLRDLWTQAYQKMQPAMTRPSYTSILALHLFGNTPTPPQSEERGATELCLGIALQHYTTMSVRTGVLSRMSKSTETASTAGEPPQALDVAAMEYAQMEDTAHWFGIICDTYRSLTGCQPSILLPSTSKESKVWISVRQEVASFQQRARSERWVESRRPLSIERIYSIVGNGSACRAMVWSAISRVQDALFHNVADISVEEAIHDAFREVNRFDEVFGGLLGICRRDFALSNEKIRISCCRFSLFLLDLDFGLGVLTLVDTLSATSNAHLIPSEYELRISSARAIVNAVSMVLQTDHYTSGSHGSNSQLLQVPYPEHIINGLLRAGSSLIHLYRTNSMSPSMVEIMFCVIFSGLETLRIVSYSAEEAFESLLSLCDDCGLRPKSYQDSSLSMIASNEISPAVGLALRDKQFLKALDENINMDPGLINTTIERHELALGVV